MFMAALMVFALVSTGGVDSSSVTQTEIITALDSELERLFDARVGAANDTDKLTITDQAGRRIKVTQGAGDGTMFGTDATNNGGLLAIETTRNNITAAFNGDNLVVTNTAGGKVALSGFSAQASSQVVFNTVNDAQSEGVNEPILLAQANDNQTTQASATILGKVENSQVSLRFSDLVGTGSTAGYGFTITNGAGDVYASVDALNVLSTIDADVIKASVMAALSSGVANLAGTDSSFDVQEWDVSYAGGNLSITNTMGRAIGVENFSSTDGFLTVTPVNEVGAAEVLASQNAYYSETRVQLNTSAFGQDLSAADTNLFTFSVDGVQNSAALVISVQGSAGSTSAGLVSGAIFAASVQEAVRASEVYIRNPNDGSVIAAADLSNVSVTYDADTAELVFRDSNGRALGFGYNAASNNLTGLGIGPLKTDSVTGDSNKSITVDRTSTAAQGDVINASEVTLTFSTANASFNFTLNGNYLDGASTNASAGMANAVSANFGTDVATLTSKLDALMTKVNGAHANSVFEYSLDGSAKTITIRQRDGGEVIVGGFVTATTHKSLTAALTAPSGQATAQTLAFYGHDKALAATAVGTQGVATTATLNVTGDDVFSMIVSDGTKSYTASNLIVDTSDTTSTTNFAASIEDALLGSKIGVSMDNSGNIYFSRSDGGAIVLQSFTSSNGSTGTWTPGSSQGNTVALAGTGTVAGASIVSGSSSSSSSSGGVSYTTTGGTSISGMSITSQNNASAAIAIIDSALNYVQAERSNLGAITNRLTYTVDNLTNAMTNAASARSRVLDTDYAAETAELARTQIIQQAATAMLAQANQQPQMVLALLQ
jgi:flagellin